MSTITSLAFGPDLRVDIESRADAYEYEFVFDSRNPNWVAAHEVNHFFLTSYQHVFNDLLAARGHVFLNEVLDAIGFARVQVGQIVGWDYDMENDKGRLNFVHMQVGSVGNVGDSFVITFITDGPIIQTLETFE